MINIVPKQRQVIYDDVFGLENLVDISDTAFPRYPGKRENSYIDRLFGQECLQSFIGYDTISREKERLVMNGAKQSKMCNIGIFIALMNKGKEMQRGGSCHPHR